MNVKLISVTKSLITEKDLSPEDLIVYIARVSNPSNQLNTETSEKLVRYLINHKHWSPFEMVDMTVEVTTSRAIAAQILRHRSFSFQEFSQRYSQNNEMEPIEIRKSGATNRQSSREVFDPFMGNFGGYYASNMVNLHLEYSQKLYDALIDSGVAKECARMVLPLTTQTRLYMKGSIRSWIHYLSIRCDENTQKEHRDIADAIKYIFKIEFPNISKIFDNE